MTAYVDRQTTLADQVTLTGIGVHSGKPASITLVPAEAGVGIVFTRTDQENSTEVPALWNKVSATALCTVLGDPSSEGVATVEHLMAALFGMGVDNLIVEIDGPEMPVMDGSSVAFVEAIEQIGLKRLDRGRRYLKVKKTVRVDNGTAWCELHPYNGTKFDITIDFDTPLIGRQQSEQLGPMVEREIAIGMRNNWFAAPEPTGQLYPPYIYFLLKTCVFYDVWQKSIF